MSFQNELLQFFGKIVKDINLYYQILNDADWYEINTTKEYNESFRIVSLKLIKFFFVIYL